MTCRAAEADVSAARVSLRVHARRLTIDVDHVEIAEYLMRAYASLVQSAGAAGELPTDRAEIRWSPAPQLCFNGVVEPLLHRDLIDEPWLAGFYGSRQLVRRSLREQPPWAALYAAAVVLGGRAVALIGASGSGKTTTACALVVQGARFLGDEYVAFDAERGVVGPFPSALMIRDDALRRLDDERLRAACLAERAYLSPRWGRVWHGVDPARVFGAEAIAEPAPLGAVVLLGTPAAVPHIAPVPRAVAALEARRMLHARSGDLPALSAILERFASVPAYRVHPGEPAATARALIAMLT